MVAVPRQRRATRKLKVVLGEMPIQIAVRHCAAGFERTLCMNWSPPVLVVVDVFVGLFETITASPTFHGDRDSDSSAR